MEKIVKAKNLVKHFDTVKAVNGISFDVDQGTCIGLLGPNGAGKTTTVEMMEGILSPTSGEVFYRDEPLNERFRNEAGMQFQSTALPEFINVREILEMFSGLYQNPTPIAELVDLCDLSEFLEQDNARLSGGQRQRLLLAVALINDLDILFLDEPTTGLDPQARRNFWDLINMIKSKNKTIVLTTHYMDEAYALCDEIIIIDHGKIIAQGSPKKLLVEYFNESFVQLPLADFTLDKSDYPNGTSVKFDQVEIVTTDVNHTINELLKQNISLSNMGIRSANLEDLFIKLTGKGLRE
jgi:ABC-2 type transport system ATP-binding protein